MMRRVRTAFAYGRWSARCAILAGSLAVSSCETPPANRELRQRTNSYQFNITTPNVPPAARDDVTYVLFVRDRKTGQPIETGEGTIYARAGFRVDGTLAKAPQVGQYRGTLRFPGSGGWRVGVRFRESPTKELELVQWMQEVRSVGGVEKTSRITPPWSWGAGAKR